MKPIKLYQKKNWHFAKQKGEYVTDDGWIDIREEFKLVGIEKAHNSNCDRCNTAIKYNCIVYHKDYGYKIVGRTCITHISDADKEYMDTAIALHKASNDILNREWKQGKTKSGIPFIEAMYSHSKLRIYGNGKQFQVGVKMVGRRNWYEWSSKVTVNKSLDIAKRLSFITFKGLKSELDKEKEVLGFYYKELINNH